MVLLLFPRLALAPPPLLPSPDSPGRGAHHRWARWTRVAAGAGGVVAVATMPVLRLVGHWRVPLPRQHDLDEPTRARGDEAHRITRPCGGAPRTEAHGPPDEPWVSTSHGSGTGDAARHGAMRPRPGLGRPGAAEAGA